jgi:glycosyltransferase involved in cell wall biosynthesis
VAELLVELSSACDVEAFVDDGVVPEHDLVGRFPVHHFSAFERRAPFDAVVYEMGASVLHRFVHDGALRHPGTGIAALHDLPWSYVEWATGGDGFRDRLAELEGEEAAAEFNRLAEEAQRRGVELGDSAALDFWARHPMLGPVVEATKAQIVHGPAGAEELTERYPAARPYDVVLGVGDPYEERPGIDVASVRAGAGLPTDVFIAGVFGIVHPSKRIESCIRSLAEVDGDAMLLVVGRVLDPSYEDHLLELARSLAVASRVRFSGPTSFEDFLALQVAVDVILNLRSPLVRQWSGTLMRGLAAGKPVIISDVPYWASMPDDVCSRVTTGGAEVAQLTEQLDKFRVDDDLRRDIGARARSWFEENATVRRMAEGYLDVIEEVTGTVVARDWPTHTDETWARLVKAVQR